MSYRPIVSVAKFLVLAASLSVVLPSLAGEPEVRVTEAWIREAPPVSAMLAGYLIIENESAEAIAVVGASSPAFARIEIHRTEVQDGVARMRRQDRVDVPPGDTQRFEPGGYHLMLMKPERALTEGERIELELSLEDGKTIQLEMEVKKGEGH